MPILWRRMSISSRSVLRSKLSPWKTISPRLGSTRRDMQRTSVDLPEPDSPMMTKISAWRTSMETSRTARTRPAATSCSSEGSGCWARKASAPWPNSFQTFRQLSVIVVSAASGAALAAVVVVRFIGSTVVIAVAGRGRQRIYLRNRAGGRSSRQPGILFRRSTGANKNRLVCRRVGPGAPLCFVGVDPGIGHVVELLAVEVDLPREKAQFLRIHGEVLGDVPGN